MSNYITDNINIFFEDSDRKDSYYPDEGSSNKQVPKNYLFCIWFGKVFYIDKIICDLMLGEFILYYA